VIGSMATGLDAIAAHPVETIVGALAVLLSTAGIGFALRRATVRLWSLRAQLLAISLAGTVVGALVAWLLATAMILDEAQLIPTLAVLVVTFVLATVIVTIASAPLGATAHRLADTVVAIEGGDHGVRTGIARRDELGRIADSLDQLTVQLAELEAERGRLDTEQATMLSSIPSTQPPSTRPPPSTSNSNPASSSSSTCTRSTDRNRTTAADPAPGAPADTCRAPASTTTTAPRSVTNPGTATNHGRSCSYAARTAPAATTSNEATPGSTHRQPPPP